MLYDLIAKVAYYSHEPNWCMHCKNMLSYQRRTNKFCSVECSIEYKKLIRLEEIKNGIITEPRALKEYLLHANGHMCEVCKYTEWNDRPISLEMHHIDGNCKNNDFSNLILICPNCHAQTNNYKSKNKFSTRIRGKRCTTESAALGANTA